MISSFRSKALRLFYEKDDSSKLQPSHINRIQEILGFLDTTTRPEQMNQPGYKFHELTGDRKGTYSVKIDRIYRITFRFEGEDAADVDYEDYH